MPINRPLARASYESCLDVTARLSAYVTSKPFLEAPEVNTRQDLLAINDLVSFCINARRLIENIGLKDLVSQTNIKTNAVPMSLWKIIGGLIHHDDLMIIRSESRWKMFQAMLDSTKDDKFWERVGSHLDKPVYDAPITPLVLFKSDKIPYTLIYLEEFVQIFSEKIILAVIKKALDEDLCLVEPPFRDVEMSKEALLKIVSRAK